MRKATFASLVFVVCGYAANAQFTLTPKAGIEQSFTSLKNGQGIKTSLDNIVSPQFSVRLDYRFKNIHGPFAGLAASRSVIAEEYDNPMSSVKDFNMSAGKLNVRLEAGYMYNSPAIKLGRTKAAATKSAAPAVTRRTCGGYTYTSRCGSRYQQAAQTAAKKVEPLNLRIQPFAGAAFLPASIITMRTFLNPGANYVPGMPDRLTYKTDKWNTALIAGTNFEIAKGTQKKLVVAVQYFRTANYLQDVTAAPVENVKPIRSEYQTAISSWNITVGVPFTFGKKKTAVKQAAVAAPAAPAAIAAPAAPVQEAKKAEEKKPEQKKHSCAQYRSRCGNWQ